MPESILIPEVGLSSGSTSRSPSHNKVDYYSTMELSTSTSSSPKPVRDSSWLQVDLCRDFQRDTCPRGQTCRFAHPESRAVIVKDGKVTCCYDFLKVFFTRFQMLQLYTVCLSLKGEMSKTSVQVLPSSNAHQGEIGLCWQAVWCNDVDCTLHGLITIHGNNYSKHYSGVPVENRARQVMYCWTCISLHLFEGHYIQRCIRDTLLKQSS